MPATYPTFAMKFSFVCLLALGASALTSLYGGPVPITPAQLGYNSSVTFGPSGQPEYLVCPADVNGCGGAFTENIGGINATIWCVDSQLMINWNTTYSAYIEDLNGAPGPFDANHVHYDGITSHTSSPNWLYDLTGYGVSNPDTALTRYELAAILISQYVPADNMPLNNAENQSIQDAIWHLTENDTLAAASLSDPINVGTPSGYADWIAYAANTLNTGGFDFSRWAVISGGWDPVNYFSGHSQYQTFLVQVTPEPRFYGVLLAALLGLCGVIYRRRVIL